MLIGLTREELALCEEFSLRCAEHQQQIEFGQSDTAPRQVGEIGRDNLIGKIAEVAFAKMLGGAVRPPGGAGFQLLPQREVGRSGH